jgi:hypothetical protein
MPTKYTLFFNANKRGSMRTIADTFETVTDALHAAERQRNKGRFPYLIVEGIGDDDPPVWSVTDRTVFAKFLSANPTIKT